MALYSSFAVTSGKRAISAPSIGQRVEKVGFQVSDELNVHAVERGSFPLQYLRPVGTRIPATRTPMGCALLWRRDGGAAESDVKNAIENNEGSQLPTSWEHLISKMVQPHELFEVGKAEPERTLVPSVREPCADRTGG